MAEAAGDVISRLIRYFAEAAQLATDDPGVADRMFDAIIEQLSHPTYQRLRPS
jgi:hypothetical protein